VKPNIEFDIDIALCDLITF